MNQQRAYIQAHYDADIVVREYTGDTSRGGRKVEEWTLQVWRQEVTEADVMIFIPQIIMMAFQRGFLSVTEFSLFGASVIHLNPHSRLLCNLDVAASLTIFCLLIQCLTSATLRMGKNLWLWFVP